MAASCVSSHGAKKKAALQCIPLCCRGFPDKETKSEVAASPIPFWRVRKRAVLQCNACVLGGPQPTAQNQKWLPHPCLGGGPERGQYCNVTLAFSGVPTQGDKIRSGCLTHAFFGRPKEGEIAMQPLRSGVSPNNGTKSEVAASPLPSWGAHKRAELIHNPCIMGGCQTRRQT